MKSLTLGNTCNEEMIKRSEPSRDKSASKLFI